MRIALVVACAVAGGCVTDGEPELGTTETHVETPNRLAANRLAANRLAANRLAANGLAGSTTDLATLASDEAGVELLTYMVSCALPAGDSLAVGAYVFAGQVGLAPKWTERGMKDSERRWVSACLLARVNLFGVSVQLSLRGTTGALTTPNTERTGYTLLEGAFYGDVFSTTQVMDACTSRLKATAPQISTMPLRECTVPDGTGLTRCGFTATGICEDVCTGTAGDRYTSCGPSAEVISVYLENP